MEQTARTYTISGLDCPDCAKTLEAGICRLKGVTSCKLNFTTATLHVSGDATDEAVAKRVEELGFGLIKEQGRRAGLPGFFGYLIRQKDTILLLVAALLILPGLIFEELFPMLGIESPVFIATSIGALVIAGFPIVLDAVRGLFVGKEITINLLMTIAGIGAVFIGAYTEAGLVMVLFSLGEAIEGYTMERSRNAIKSLMEVAPNVATVLRPCMDCREHLGKDGYKNGPCPFCSDEEQRLPVERLVIGDRIVVLPGERIAMDGVIVQGATSVNQAPITGESVPVGKIQGDEVYAGSVNGEGAIEIKVTRLARDNTISRIIRMVEEAQERRSKAQRFVDRFAKFYTPSVIALSVLVATVPPLFFNAPFLSTASNQGWLYKALELLVVGCPCALVVSTPVTIVSAIGNAARNGVLIKGGSHLEALGGVKAFAFDKTGTLTLGKPSVDEIKSKECTNPQSGVCDNCSELLAIASAVERRSEHPLAQAVVNEAQERGVHEKYPAASDVKVVPGKGVGGSVGGEKVFVGSHDYFDANVPHDEAHCNEINEKSVNGKTPMLVSSEKQYLGYITVSDAVRDTSKKALSALKKLGVKVLAMLTGDNPAVANTIAQQVGITDVYAGLLPESKVLVVDELESKYGKVAMVGDGINDAPALAAATVGIAIGAGGTAQAMETADIVLMSGDLSRLPFAYRLAKLALATIRQNIAFILAVKATFFVVVLLGFGTMWMAVIADVGTSLVATIYGMRLLRLRLKD